MKYLLGVMVAALAASAGPAAPVIERITITEDEFPRAVVVDAAPLAHTGQILGWGKDGKLVAPGGQAKQTLDNLESVLKECGADPKQLVRLNLHYGTDLVADLFLAEFVRRYSPGEGKLVAPAITRLKGNLPEPGAVIAVDAVAVARATNAVERVPGNLPSPGGTSAAILPTGPRAYVAGQAEKGAGPAEATRKTLQSLRNTLKYMGLNDSHIVQCKCFLTPMSARDDVIKEFEDFYGKGKVPPLVFVEWKSSLPIEIELIAHAPAPKRQAWDEIDFLTPPGMTVSPVYSRVARVHADKSIYIGMLKCPADRPAKEQVESIFAQLKILLEKTGSDFRHLAKATYFVSDDDCSKLLNEMRPNYFDPRRPPSASKAMVAKGTIPERGIALDMIAVPSTHKKEGKPEVGHGLTAEQARDGWISLFDGKTAFGWSGAKVADGSLVGGRSLGNLGEVELVADLAAGGEFTAGGRTHKVGVGIFKLDVTVGKGPIDLGKGVAARSIIVRPRGLKSIMPGENLKGWKRIDRATIPEQRRPKWTLKDGVLEAVGGPGALEYPTLYGDAVIQVEVKSRNRHANGGLFFRSIPGDFMNGYEAQIHSACEKGDPAKPAEYATGGIDDRRNARRLISRDYEPFIMTVIADGPHIATWVNGYHVVDWTDTRKQDENPRQGLRLKAGTIQLQAHDPATDLEFREIRVAEIK